MIVKTPSLMTSLTKIYDEIITQKSKTVCFTSSVAKEGITTIACAVAEVATSLNQKVLYCDFSDYSNSLSKHFKKKFNGSQKDAVEQVYDNIHFIESLKFYLLPQPTQLIPTFLRKGFLPVLLDHLKKDYDLIIIDTNYYNCYIEGELSANHLVQVADSTVLIALTGVVTEVLLKRTADKIIHDGGKIIGVILNDFNYPKLSDELVRASHHLDQNFPDAAEKLRLWVQESDFFNTEN